MISRLFPRIFTALLAATLCAVIAPTADAAPTDGRMKLVTSRVQQGSNDDGWNKVTHFTWVDTYAGRAEVQIWNANTKVFEAWNLRVPDAPAPRDGKRAVGRYDLLVMTLEQGGLDGGWTKISHFIWVDTVEGTAEVFVWNHSGNVFEPWKGIRVPPATRAAARQGVSSGPGRYQLETLLRQQGDINDGWGKVTHFVWTDTVTATAEVFVWNANSKKFEPWNIKVPGPR